MKEKEAAELIRDRIVGFGRKPADQFTANPLNWRVHPKKQQLAVAASLRDLGWIDVAIENVTTGNLVDGHERVWQALRNGGDVPYIQVELSPEEEAQALATLDPMTGMATADAGILEELLRHVSTGEEAIQEMLGELAEDVGIIPPLAEGGDAEPQIDRAEELRKVWGVEPGQLWRLPSRTPGQEHRIVCGDCTDAAVVERVMGGERADLVVTDPPYAIYGSSTGIGGDVTDDNMVRPFMRMVVALFQTYTRLGAHIYTFCDWRSWAAWWAEIKSSQLVVRNCIVWDKGDGGLGSNYTMRHELVIFAEHTVKAVTMTAAAKSRKARVVHGRANVQRFNVPQGDERLHNAAKPLELLAVFLDASSDVGDVLFDPFLGSGTVLIACENLGRQCRAVEISPGYVAVALQRYMDAFGIVGELVS